ncbi:helix-turn-helix domain-containing protein [Glaciecola sp. 1036]|uniref:helix-turn-helix domain-containing protein n=1 Tax=Alteromonadaceae TaxID=72275 RepID=UPI003D01A40E
MINQSVSLMLATLCFIAVYLPKGAHLFGFRLLMLISGVGMLLDYGQNALQLFTAPYAIAIIFALGPCYYFFISFLLRQPQKPILMILHAIPALISLFFLQYPQELILIGTLSQFAYIVFCLYLIRQYHLAIVQITSDAYSHQLKWIIPVFYITGVNKTLELVRLNLQPELGPQINNFWQMLGNLVTFGLVVFILKQLVYYSKVFKEWNSLASGEHSPENQNAESIFKQIKRFVLEHDLHLTLRLTIRSIAEQMGISEKDISWAVNQGGNTNFNDFINALRIEHFKQQVSIQGQSSNLLDLAFSSGFNSKSSFNAVFKKHTGLTPSAYLKALT